MKKTSDITKAAIIAAIYMVLTLAFKPISFGVIQCRISEALCILPVFSPSAIWGLFIGCLLSNLLSGTTLGLIDIIGGSLTTLLAGFLTYKCRKNVLLAASFPVLLNGIIVGGYLSYFFPEQSIWYCMLSVAAGELIAVYLIGIPFYHMTKNKLRTLL